MFVFIINTKYVRMIGLEPTRLTAPDVQGLLILTRVYTELFFKAGREVGKGIETGHVRYFGDGIGPFLD